MSNTNEQWETCSDPHWDSQAWLEVGRSTSSGEKPTATTSIGTTSTLTLTLSASYHTSASPAHATTNTTTMGPTSTPSTAVTHPATINTNS